MATPSSEAQNNQLPILSSADFPFGEKSTAVISDAYKFVLPVPALGDAAEPLIYPAGHEQAGQPILDWQDQPIGDWGIVFFNEKDQAYQAVPADGEGVIIINGVSPEQAEKIDEKVRSLASSFEQLTFDHLKEVLFFTLSELHLGDMYNSTRTYATENLIAPVNRTNKTVYGIKKRNKEEIFQAIHVPEPFSLKSVTATQQKFKSGGVVINKKGEQWGIQPDIFLKTYRLADGTPINSLENDIVSLRIDKLRP